MKDKKNISLIDGYKELFFRTGKIEFYNMYVCLDKLYDDIKNIEIEHVENEELSLN